MNQLKRRGRPGLSKSGGSKEGQVLERGIAILYYSVKPDSGLLNSDISNNPGFSVSITFCLLKTLGQADFVYQDTQLGWWHIELTVFTVGLAYIHNRDVLSVMLPFTQRLMLPSGETVNIAIRNKNKTALIGQAECQFMVRMRASIGSRPSLYASVVGKTFLYPLDEKELMDTILQAGLKNFTSNTLIDLHQVQLNHSKQCHYSIDQKEHTISLTCIASAIYERTGKVIAGLFISGLSALPERFSRLGQFASGAICNIRTTFGLIMTLTKQIKE